MSRVLHIGDRFTLPLDWITLATVIYGARGSGKTSLGAVMAEEATKANQRFCAIDLKGDWYGLKSTADGKGDGIAVVIFGGDHADVPLEPDAGAFVGETVATLGQSVILDMEHFSKGKQVRFLAAFFEALYDKNREPLLLFLWQPWASLCVSIDPQTERAAKSFETRHWKPTVGLPCDVVIHASKRWTGEQKRLLLRPTFCETLIRCGYSEQEGPELPLGALVGVVTLAKVWDADDVLYYADRTGTDFTAERSFGDFSAGRFAWEFQNPRRFDIPKPWKGHQGFFDVPDDIVQRALKAA